MRKFLYYFFSLIFLANFSCSKAQGLYASSGRGQSVSDNYELFKTENFWVFIKLDTRNGKMTQVHYSLDRTTFRGEKVLNPRALVSKAEERRGRFTLYPTHNMYNFILLDKLSGATYQVQWSLDNENRFIVPL